MTDKALFLDRDGVINVDHGYVHRVQDFEFMDGIFELCLRFQQADHKIFVMTNQAGIGRGYYQEADFKNLTDWMVGEFKQQGITINAVYHCPHHPTKAKGDYLKQCECRKPAPGMILRAADEWQLNLAKSVFVGDKVSDMQAAANAAVGRRILLSSDYHNDEPTEQVELVGNLNEIEPN